jgi:hypothetical protein
MQGNRNRVVLEFRHWHCRCRCLRRLKRVRISESQVDHKWQAALSLEKLGETVVCRRLLWALLKYNLGSLCQRTRETRMKIRTRGDLGIIDWPDSLEYAQTFLLNAKTKSRIPFLRDEIPSLARHGGFYWIRRYKCVSFWSCFDCVDLSLSKIMDVLLTVDFNGIRNLLLRTQLKL